ncbi:MAG: hypothetical protein HLX50_13210 [Alteromonadaceae bacterium]|nr:hypothetical protein [Alteromonadaceae bacterium]
MKREYTLYNFDHGFKKEKTFCIGKFRISVSDEQAKNISKLEQNAKRSFVMNNDLSREMKELPKKKGRIVETATLRVTSTEIAESLIYKELPKRTSIDDFVLFLSFITGRRVFLDHEIELETPTNYFDRVVNNNFFHFPLVDIDGGLKKIDELKLSTQLYNLVHTKTVRDLPAICFYANTVVNALYERWCKNNNKSKYPAPGIKADELKERISQILERSLVDKFKIWVNSILSGKSYDADAIHDVVARVNISSQPSALYKLQNFLVGLRLFPENPTKEATDRLRWTNKVRNMMVHMGDIPSDKNIGFEQRVQIATSITFLLIGIAEHYYAKEIFSINNYLVDQNAKDIREYFDSGIFRGHKVFDETYERFCERQESEWVENGNHV